MKGRKKVYVYSLRDFISKKIIFKVLPFVIMIAFFIAVRIAFSLAVREDFFEHYSVSEEDGVVIAGDEITNYAVKADKNNVYLSFDFVKNYIDPYIFRDEPEGKITITTEDKVIRMENEELEYFVNNEPLELDMPFFIQDGEAYIPSEILKSLYKIRADYNEESNILSVDFNEDYYTAELRSKTDIYYEDKLSSKRLEKKAEKGSVVYVYPKDSTQNFTMIKTMDGYVGYIRKNLLTEPVLHKADEQKNTQNTMTNQIKGKINLSFDHITRYEANNRFDTPVPDGVNVMCPTWFSFEDTQGTMKSLADKAYVDAVHENGAQVWALLSDNFTQGISHGIIASSESRQKVIKQLLAYVSLYELDGINIDFEAVPSDEGEYYIQFLRELAVPLRAQGGVLSVDMFVPKNWTKHYRREEAAQTADYIIVMGYDEHYAADSTSGSVASIGWSRDAVELTLNQNVPKDKLVLAVPFYTRLWKEEGGNVSSSAYSMDDAFELVAQKGCEVKWLDDIGQYYAEYTENNAVYKIWLEDKTSIKQRIALVDEYGIAGCAHWRRGFESEDIWEVIDKELNGDSNR